MYLVGLLSGSLNILNVEEANLVGRLAGGDDLEPITELLLLEELLDEILEVTLGEGSLGLDGDLGLLAVDLDVLAELTSLAVHLDAVVQELVQLLGGEDVVLSGQSALNHELELRLLGGLLDDLLHIFPPQNTPPAQHTN